MKIKLNRLFAMAALGLLSVAASALPAAAQGRFDGHFRLPCEVRWQNATLPAGDYTFTLPSVSYQSAMVVSGPDGSVFEVPREVSTRVVDGRNVLILEQHDGTYFVREMDLSVGQLKYRMPKASQNEKLLAKAAAPQQIIIAMVTK
jgi:hypothetical protein